MSLTRPQALHLHRYEPKAPQTDPLAVYDVLPASPHHGIKGHAFLQAIADDSEFIEVKKNFVPGRGTNILTGKIRIKGLPVGVICSNGAGIIFHEAAKKVAEWVGEMLA